MSLRDVPPGATPELPASIFPGGPPWLPMPDQPASEPAADDTDDEGHQGSDGPSADETDARRHPADEVDDTLTMAAAVTAAGVAAADPLVRQPAPAGDAEDDRSGAPYGDQLALLFSLIDDHGADGSPLAEALRDALERGITTFDAALDESDEGSEDEDEPLVQVRNAAADLIDALRVIDTSDEPVADDVPDPTARRPPGRSGRRRPGRRRLRG